MSFRPESNKLNNAPAHISSPMSSRPYNQQGSGGLHPGDKDGLKETVALGAPKASTAGGPVGIQVTEDVQAAEGKHGHFPTGTSIRTATP